MTKIKDFRNKHKFLFAFIVIILINIAIAIISFISRYYDKYFNYDEIPYCEDGYELENGGCIKLIVTDEIEYKCPDNYESDGVWSCKIKSEYTMIPNREEYCSDEYEEIRSGDSLICKRKEGMFAGTYAAPKERDACEEGYTLNHLRVCVRDDVKDLDYNVKSTVVCPEGYTYQTVRRWKEKAPDASLCMPGTGCAPNNNDSTNNYIEKTEEACAKKEHIKPKYRKEYN